MPLTKQRKAQLDRYLLDFNKYATRIIETVSKKHPKAQVSIKFLMNCYAAGIWGYYVSKQIMSDYRLKTGED